MSLPTISENAKVWPHQTLYNSVDDPPLYYVNIDPTATFTNTYCLKCFNEWYDPSDSSDNRFALSGPFNVQVECPSNGFEIHPPSSMVEIQHADLSLDPQYWPTFQFDSFHTNSRAC